MAWKAMQKINTKLGMQQKHTFLNAKTNRHGFGILVCDMAVLFCLGIHHIIKKQYIHVQLIKTDDVNFFSFA